MAYADRNSGKAKLPTYAVVALVHVAIGYAFLSGLAGQVIEQGGNIIIAYPVPADRPPPPPLPTPRAKPEPHVAQKPVFAPEPKIVPLPPTPTTLDRLPTQRTIDPTDTEIAPVPPSPPAPDLGSAATAKGNKADWFGTDDYPSSSLRSGAHGVVGIAATVGVDGRIAACAVTRSSGDAALDAATCRLYGVRARYRPARDAGGTPVEAKIADTVTWQIPE